VNIFQRDKKIVMKELAVLAISIISISACRGMSTTATPKEMSTTSTPTHQPLPSLSRGMTTSEVIELWGEPQKTSRERVPGGVALFWHYLPPVVNERVELMFWNGRLQSW